MDYKELADRLEKRYKGNETGSTFVTLCSRSDVLNAATAITELFSRAEEAEAERDEARQDCAIAERNHMIEVERRQAAESRAEKAERERDAAVFDLLRAEEAAEETNVLLDVEVHPACDYSLYLAVHDSVSDIVNWEHDDVWRGHKEEKE